MPALYPKDPASEERFRRTRRLQAWANFLVLSGVAVALLAMPTWTTGKFSAFFGVLFAYLLFTIANWRCPYCHASLGRPGMTVPDECDRCHAELSKPARYV